MAGLVLADILRASGILWRLPLWMMLFAASAVLSLIGSASFLVTGPSRLALPGLAGAFAAAVMLLRFASKDRPFGR